jgi:probable HAF family extracellular repeat protein
MTDLRAIIGKMPAALIAVAVVSAASALVPAGNSSWDAAAEWVARDLGKVGTTSTAVDINEQGRVVGTIDASIWGKTERHAFQWGEGRIRDLGTLPLSGLAGDIPTISEAVAINDRGQIIGTSYPNENDPVISAFLWSAGRMNELGCPASAQNSGVSAINRRGQIVGWCGDEPPWQGGPTRAVLWQDGKPRDLGTLGGSSVAVGINEHAQIVGTSGRHAFLWQNGKMTSLGALPAARTTSAVAINDRGQVVGTSGRHAFLWQHGKMTDLGALRGRRFSEAVGINSRGEIIGLSFTSFDARLAGAYRAVVWQKGRIRDLGTLGGRSSDAAAINERGQIVGASATRSGAYHAFIWENGRMTDLGTLARAKGSGAVAINERGQVVGSSTMRNHKTHAVLWTLR